jgi:hypothetical protein
MVVSFMDSLNATTVPTELPGEAPFETATTDGVEAALS